MTTERRFWAKVAKGAPGECWEWSAYRDANGYGRFAMGGRVERSHRAAWILTHGEIPAGDGYHGTCVLHACDNPACVNPSHLWLGSQADNAADMASKGRATNPTAVANGDKTHCPSGHEYTEANTYAYSNGRRCKRCIRERMRDYYRRNRAKVKARIYANRSQAHG